MKLQLIYYYKITCFQDAVNPLTEICAGDTSLDITLYSLLLLNSLLIVGTLVILIGPVLVSVIAKSLSVSSCNSSSFCISYIVKYIHASTCFVHLPQFALEIPTFLIPPVHSRQGSYKNIASLLRTI